jgi:hypothetical protein
MLTDMEIAMDKFIKNLIGINLLALIASIIYGDSSVFVLMLATQFGIFVVVVCVRVFMRELESDDVLTIEPLPDDYATPDFQFHASSLNGEGITIQPIQLSPETAIKVDSSGMKMIAPGDLIPEEVCCSVCGKNILETRYDFGGVLVCPHPDCGQWYHKKHFYDTAKGKCISPECRKRGSSLFPAASSSLPSTFELLLYSP